MNDIKMSMSLDSFDLLFEGLSILFPLQWITPSENYMTNYYRKFIRTPVNVLYVPQVINGATVNTLFVNEDAEYDDPKDVFPESYVEYIETLYGKEKPTSKIK